MEEKIWLPVYSHFQNENGWTGSFGVMEYEISPPTEEQTLKVALWYGPFSRPYAEVMEERIIPFTQEHLEELKGWLVDRGQEMNQHPQRSQAETLDVYQQIRKQEKEAKSHEG